MEQEQANDNGHSAFPLTLEDGFVVLTGVNEDGEPLEIVLGDKEESCEIMRQFLASVDYGECR